MGMSQRDEGIIREVAAEYVLTKHETALLLAIRIVENGGPGIEFGIGSDQKKHPARRFAGDYEKSLRLQAQWCAGTIKKRYRGSTLDAFAKRYCPPNHRWWAQTVREKMKRWG